MAHQVWGRNKHALRACSGLVLLVGMMALCLTPVVALNCPPGQYTFCYFGQCTCVPCPAGRYYGGGSATNCLMCTGTTYSNAGASSCSQCGAGHLIQTLARAQESLTGHRCHSRLLLFCCFACIFQGLTFLILPKTRALLALLAPPPPQTRGTKHLVQAASPSFRAESARRTAHLCNHRLRSQRFNSVLCLSP
jgi:hypothetical protein